MKQAKYIGMDVHQATTVVVVLNADGRVVWETIVATEARAIIDLLESLSGPLHVTFEETTQAGWLYDVVRGYVTEVIVCDPRHSKSFGSKSDKVDARKLADLLRAGLLRGVWHGHDATRKLKELMRGYETLSVDTIRTMGRIKAMYRGRAIATPGHGVYHPSQRDHWLGLLTESGARQRTGWLYEELDHLRKLRKQAKLAMLAESRLHKAVKLLRTVPNIGPIRSALIVATVDTPHRFRTKRQLWSYSGLSVVTHTSAEYEVHDSRVVRLRKPVSTRGLNRNANHRMKDVFVGAATGGMQTEPWKSYLQSRSDNGMRIEMARLTLARKIAATALKIWKQGDTFDPKKLNLTN